MPKKTKRVLLSRSWSLAPSLSLLLISRDLPPMMIFLFQWIILANFVLHVNTASETVPHEAHCQGLFCSAQHSCLRSQLLPGALGSRVPILPKHRQSCYRAALLFMFSFRSPLLKMFITKSMFNKSSAYPQWPQSFRHWIVPGREQRPMPCSVTGPGPMVSDRSRGSV